MSPPKKQKPAEQPAEFPDGTEIDAGANYDVADPLRIEDPDPAMRYYFAAADGDKFRPDGVARLKAMGYRVSAKEHSSPDCVLMEIPMELHEKRQAAGYQKRKKDQRDVLAPPTGLEVLPGSRHGIR